MMYKSDMLNLDPNVNQDPNVWLFWESLAPRRKNQLRHSLRWAV